METRPFRYCCGLVEIGHFYESNTYSAQYLADLILSMRSNHTHNGAIIATTIKEQKGAVRQLAALGFSALRKFKNPETDRVVTLWYLPPASSRQLAKLNKLARG